MRNELDPVSTPEPISPDDFVDYDDVDSATVTLPEDSYDGAHFKDVEVGDDV